MSFSRINYTCEKMKFSVNRIQGRKGLQLEIMKNGIVNILLENDLLHACFSLSDVTLINDTDINSLNLMVIYNKDIKSFPIKFSNPIEKFLFKTVVYNHMVILVLYR